MNLYRYIKNIDRGVYKRGLTVVLTVAGLLILSGAVYAFIQENGKVKGTTFKVSSNPGQGNEGGTSGNASLKLLKVLNGGTSATNLVDEFEGPTFENITAAWKDKVLLKVHNSGQKSLKLVSKADYANDPNTLRDDLYIKIYEWMDNGDGVLQNSEIGSVYGYDTILRMKNDTFNLDTISPGATKSFIMEFDGSGLSEANADQTAVYDFIISGEEIL